MRDGTAWCNASDIAGPSASQWLVASWALAAMLGLLLHFASARPTARPRNAWTSAGFAILSVPAWMVVVDVAPDLVRTFCAQGNVVSILPGPPPVPPSASRFSAQYIDAILRNLGYLALGALLVARGLAPACLRRPTVAGLAQALRGLLPLGRGEGASLRLGVALFPVLAAANLALAAVTGLAIVASDKVAYYSNMTAFHAVALALAAAFSEELVYRGVMQQGVLALLGRRWGQGWGPVAVAVAAQAIPFAYAHAGYGNPQLLLFAFLFAVVAGLVAQRWGIWCAIALHALVDFFAFYTSVPDPGTAFHALAVAVGAAVLLVAAWQLWPGSARLRPRPQ